MDPSASIFSQYNRLVHLLGTTDERGLVLTLAAFAEDTLGQLILAYLRPVDQSKELVEGFNAPLGTLSARVKTGYALGLLSQPQFADLDRLRRIRNEFAHTWEECSLDSGKPASLVGQMSPSRLDGPKPNEGPAVRLRSCVLCILAELSVLRGQILSGKRERLPNAAMHLSVRPLDPGPA